MVHTDSLKQNNMKLARLCLSLQAYAGMDSLSSSVPLPASYLFQKVNGENVFFQ
jgi:hypothetical protein